MEYVQLIVTEIPFLHTRNKFNQSTNNEHIIISDNQANATRATENTLWNKPNKPTQSYITHSTTIKHIKTQWDQTNAV